MLVQAKQLQCEGSLCGCPEPLGIGDTLSLGYKFEAPLLGFSQDIFEGILALHESNVELLDVTFDQKNHRLRDPDQAEEESRSSIHLPFEK